MDKENVHMYNGILLSHKKMPFAATWTDLEIIILSEVKSDRGRQILYVFTYMWNLKSKMNEYNKLETDSLIQGTNCW